MPKRTKGSSTRKSAAAVLLLCIVGAGGLAAYVKLFPAAAHVVETPPAISSENHQSGPDVKISVKPEESETATLKVPSLSSSGIQLNSPASAVPDGTKPEVSLLNDTMKSLQIDGARAVGIEVSDHLAKVDFNAGIQRGYGTMEEGNVIKAMQMALGQFPDINQFQIRVDGKIVDSLGNIDLTTPVDVIRPDGSAPAKQKRKSPTS
jgi:hypothetical protein